MRWRDLTARRPGNIASTHLTLLVAVLVAAMACAATLAYQARIAYRSQADQATQALRHFATIASWQFANATRREFEAVATVTVGFAAHDMLNQFVGHVPPLAAIRHFVARPCAGCQRTPLRSLGYFRAAAGATTSARDVELEPSTGLSAAAVYDAVKAELGNPESLIAAGSDCAVTFAYTADGVPRALSLVVVGTQSGNRIVYGAVSDVDSLAAIFARVAARTSLLPAALVDDSLQRAAVSLAVAIGGHPVFELGHPWPIVSAEPMESSDSGAVVRASLSPDLASRLLVGGLPRSRVPLIGALLALTLVLFGVALALIARGAQLARARSDFIASMSHELRTPVALVRAHADTLLREGALERSDHRRFLEVVVRESTRLTRLLENALHVSVIERGTLEVSVAVIELTALLRHAVMDFAPIAHTRNATIEANLGHEVCVLADHAALHQIIFNVLGNALKYGPEGQHIRLTVEHRDGDVLVLFDDEGPGIPPPLRDVAFRRYARLVTVEDGAPAGAGIGLSIVRELAEAQGMSVWIDAAPRCGARVVLRISTMTPAEGATP